MSVPSQFDAQLRELLRVFLVENGKLNLSALRTEEAGWIGHILDSLAALELPDPLPPQGKYLDVGTGGGFPLLPLAITLPEASFVGLDATQKKVLAVERIIQETKINNAMLVAGRAEELGHDPMHREQYDVVLSRAVASLATLLEYTVPFAKVNGRIILWKSLNIDEELQSSLEARSTLSTHLTLTHKYQLPGDWGERQLLVFTKAARTPRQYPRINGIPSKMPIGMEPQ